MDRFFAVGLVVIGILIGVALTIITLFTFDAVAEETETYKCWVICKPEDYVNIRKLPSKRSSVAGWATSGLCLETDWEQKNGYLHVLGVTEYGEGWVSAGYVVFTEPSVIDSRMTVIGSGRVAVRKCVDGKRISWIRPGQTVLVYAMDSEWAVTNRGFIRAEYLEGD